MEKITILLSDGSEMTLGFSNNDKVVKFLGSYEEEIKTTNESIMKIYKQMFHINLDALAIVRYYLKLERRLFYIEHKGEIYRCLNEIEFQLNSLKKSEI